MSDVDDVSPAGPTGRRRRRQLAELGLTAESVLERVVKLIKALSPDDRQRVLAAAEILLAPEKGTDD